jgi:phosphoribosyl 1,2-cyclic phosphate phosphodiesterase
MKLIVLGSGTSTGVPRIGDDWGECDPLEPRNRRTRVSVIVEDEGKRVLVDTSPDLRQQLLENKIAAIDAVVWTHDHADHCHGIDDLRVMRYGRSNPIPGFASPATMARLKRRFGYVFEGRFGYPTLVELGDVEQVRLIAGMAVDTVEMPHGGDMKSTGYRFDGSRGSIAYATDFANITDGMIDCFRGVDVLVTDCLRREEHPTHAHLALALELAERVEARRTVLTHLDKSMDYHTLAKEVPAGIIVGHDGLEVAL